MRLSYSKTVKCEDLMILNRATSRICKKTSILFFFNFDETLFPLQWIKENHIQYLLASKFSAILSEELLIKRKKLWLVSCQVKRIFKQRTIKSMTAEMLIYQAATGTPKSFASRLTTTTSPLTNWSVIFFDFTKFDWFM